LIIAPSPLRYFPCLGDDFVASVAIAIVQPLRRLGEIVREGRNDEISSNRGLLADNSSALFGEGKRPDARLHKHVEQNESRWRFQ
jgi:hypothetical protein